MQSQLQTRSACNHNYRQEVHAITITDNLPSKGKMTFVAAFLSQILQGDEAFDFWKYIFL